MSSLLQDVRYSIRTLRKNRGFTTVAVVTLALGIGANTAMFSFADSLMFRPLDVPRPGDLVRVFTSTKAGIPYGPLSYPDYVDYRSRTTSLSGLVAYNTVRIGMRVTRDEVPQLFGGLLVSGNFFSVLDVEPTLGRAFRDAEDRVPGAHPVVVISHNLWERHFRSDPAVIGTRVNLNGHDFTIIAVAPARFSGVDVLFHQDLFVPLMMSREVTSSLAPNILEDRSQRWLAAMGRLKAGVNATTASSELDTNAKALERAYPESNQGRTATALPDLAARQALDPSDAQAARIMLGIVGLVLLIACANIANLLLAQATGRTREIALRLALGASRRRLVGQLLTESIILACAGGAAGLLVAEWGVSYLSSIKLPTDLPIAWEPRLDQRVLLFTLAISLVTGIVFGLAPAFRGTRVDVVSALKASARRFQAGRHRIALRDLLVVSQVAVSIVLSIGAGMSIRGFLQARHLDPGFRPDHVLLLSFDPTLVQYSESQTKQFYRVIVDRAKELPGVESVGLAQFIPLGVQGAFVTLVVEGHQMPPGQDRLLIETDTVDPGFWRAMRAPIVRGRAFGEQDTDSSSRVIIVNETMAKQYWPDQDALGKVVRLRDRNGPPAQVIGIARDGKYHYLAEPPQPFAFLPLSQRNRSGMTMAVRTIGDPADLAAPLRAAVHRLDPNLPVFNVRTLNDFYNAKAMMFPRVTSQIVTSIGLLGVVLAMVGLYGVVAYVTARRTHEIGIRMALGGDRWSVVLLVLRQAMAVVVIGVLLGIGVALVLAPAFARPFDLNPRDVGIFTLVPFALVLLACSASLIPARRAAKVEPMVALRYE